MRKLLLLIPLLFILAFQSSPYARRIRPFASTPSSCQENEIGYNMTSHTLIICTNSGYQALTVGGSGSFAPVGSPFITKTPDATLTNEFALSTLATGILKNTTTTGIPTVAIAGTDYENPLTFSSPLSRSVNAVSCPTCALTSNSLSQFASTTSAQLAGVLSDESGATGVFILGNFTSLTTNDVLTWNGTNWINAVASGGGGSIGTGNINMTIANAGSTGTTVNRLAKLTGAPSTAVITATNDTENAVGICTANCGTTGNATIAIVGQVDCEFDGATTAGNYVIISSITAGKCHDGGSAFPTSGAAYGKVLTTNGGAGTYSMTLMTPDIAFQNAGNGKSKPGGSNTQVQFNNNNQFGGDSDFTFATDTATITKVAVTTSLTVAGAAITNNIVQNSQSAAYTTVLADAGKHIYHPSADTTARTWTIDSNANVAYPIGAALTFVNDCSAGVVTIAITSDTLVLAGAGTTGSRTLAACGIATAVKVTSTRWIINGTGLT